MLVEPLEKYLKSNTEKYNQTRRVISEGIIAGGAARQIFLEEQFGSTDIDFYFSNWGIWDAWQNNLTRNGYSEYHSSRKARGFENIFGTKCQLIKTIYSDNPQEIFNTFDFTCCMFAIKEDHLYFTTEAAEHATNKMLVVADSSNYSYGRIGKYIRKGFFPSCPLSSGIFDEFVKYVHECKTENFLFGPTWDTIPELEEKIESIFVGFFGPSSGDY